MSNISDAIYDATSLYVDAAIKGLLFDATIICKILSYNKDDNSYVVSNDSINFLAYPEANAKYTVGTLVNVFIPEGNYSQKKIIKGKHQDADINISAYNSLDDLIIPIDPIKIDNIKINNKFNLSSFNLGLGDYKYLGVRYYPNSTMNNYSLQILEYSNHYSTQAINTFEFTNHELIGNSKYQNGTFVQEKIFLLPDNFDINHQFKLQLTNVTLGYVDEEVDVNNFVEIYLAYDQMSFTKDTFSFRKINQEQELENKYSAGLVWLHKDEISNKFKIMSSDDAKNMGYEIQIVEGSAVEIKIEHDLVGDTALDWVQNKKILPYSENNIVPYICQYSTSLSNEVMALYYQINILQNNSIIYSSNYLYWGIIQDESPIGFLSFSDEDYYDGYYLFETYLNKKWELTSLPQQTMQIYNNGITSEEAKTKVRNINFIQLRDDIEITGIGWELIGAPFVKPSFDYVNLYTEYEVNNSGYSYFFCDFNKKSQYNLSDYLNFSFNLQEYNSQWDEYYDGQLFIIPIICYKITGKDKIHQLENLMYSISAKQASEMNIKLTCYDRQYLKSIHFCLNEDMTLSEENETQKIHSFVFTGFNQKIISLTNLFLSYHVSASWVTSGAECDKELVTGNGKTIQTPFNYKIEEKNDESIISGEKIQYISLNIEMSEQLKEEIKNGNCPYVCYNVLKLSIQGYNKYASGKLEEYNYFIPIVLRTKQLYVNTIDGTSDLTDQSCECMILTKHGDILISDEIVPYLEPLDFCAIGRPAEIKGVETKEDWEEDADYFRYYLRLATFESNDVYTSFNYPCVHYNQSGLDENSPIRLFNSSKGDCYVYGDRIPLSSEMPGQCFVYTNEKTKWIQPIYLYSLE